MCGHIRRPAGAGLDLPLRVLRRLYYDNAAAFFRLKVG